jgi:phosphate transport system substrate-binding protein
MPDFRMAILCAGVALSLVSCDRSAPPAPQQPAASASSASQGGPVETGTVQVSGSSALQPLVNAAKEKFEASHKGISVEVSAGGSKKGLADVAAGAVQVGDSDIFAPADLKGKLVDHKVAVIGFAAMANKGAYNEKITAIGLAELARIFSGDVKNWKDVGGGNVPIVVINRAPGSGTRSVFGSVVLGGDKFVESQTEDNSGALVAKLKQTKGSISYLAMSFADSDLLTFGIKSDAASVEASVSNITSGSYPIWSYEHMYTQGPPTGVAKEFIDYILSPAFQNQVLPTVKGFIPVTQMKVSRDEN